jgi:hypothetical protein
MVCFLCNATDQIQAVRFSKMEKFACSEFQIPDDKVAKLMRPLGICANCRALLEDEVAARYAKILNEFFEVLVESGESPEVARDLLATFPKEPGELLRHPPQPPRKW